MAGWSLGEHFLRDLRYGARVFVRRPGFAAVALLTLGLGTGANTAIFTVLYNTVLHPVPYAGADRLVRLELLSPSDQRGTRVIGFSYPKFVDAVRASHSFESLAAYARRSFTWAGVGEADRIFGEIVSASYFPILEVKAVVGRTFLADEDRTPGSHPVMMVSEAFWRSRLQGRSDVVGAVVRLNGIPLTIVGVVPGWFNGESGRADVWVPLMMAPIVLRSESALTFREEHWLQVVGRLRAGVTVAQADAEVRDIVANMADPPAAGQRLTGAALSLEESKRDPHLRNVLRVLFGAVSVIVLIACVNLANLLLAQSVDREREVAVRLALGAGRGAILRQLLTESLLIAIVGAAIGLLFAAWSMGLFAALRPDADMGVWPTYTRELDLDAFTVTRPVWMFSLGLAIVTTVLFGLVPALRASRPDVREALRSDAARWRGPSRRGVGWRGLIAAQVALVFVLLAAAGLMVRSFDRLMDRPLGIDPHQILTFRLNLPAHAYERPAARAFLDRVVTRIAALPGVEAVARVRHLPVVERGTVTSVQIDGLPDKPYVGYNAVDPAFFRLFNVRLVAGRLFDAREDRTAPPVAILDASAARQLFGANSPLGHRIAVQGTQAEIVGVIADVRYEAQSQQRPIAGDVYVNFQQRDASGAYVTMRLRTDSRQFLPALRKAIAELNPELPVYDVKTMEERLAGVLSYARFTMRLMTLFAALALCLAVVGIYGTLSYAVASRQKEIGIRMAVGAQRADVLAMILREGVAVCALGLAIGLPLALGSTQTMRALVYDVAPTDPLTFAVAGAILATTAMLACSVPAYRAASVRPTTVLRQS